MWGKLVLLAGLAVGLVAVVFYVGLNVSKFDPAEFPYSKQQISTMLNSAETVLPRRDGDGEIKIWSEGNVDNGVLLNMRYADNAPLIECTAVMKSVAPDKTRVTADCSDGPASDSAIQRTTDKLKAPMFEEHILATLNKRAFNRKSVDRREAATVFANMSGMQNEALKRSVEAQRMLEEQGH